MEVLIREDYNEISRVAAAMVAHTMNSKPNAVLVSSREAMRETQARESPRAFRSVRKSFMARIQTRTVLLGKSAIS